MKCQYCKSKNVKRNRAGTIFCLDCRIAKNRGEPNRMDGHPLYESHGWRIRPGHPDAEMYRRDLRK
jgi:hypothetical protein